MSIFSRSPFNRDPDASEDGRPLRWAALALIALLLAFGGWLGFSALDAKSNLEHARQSAHENALLLSSDLILHEPEHDAHACATAQADEDEDDDGLPASVLPRGGFLWFAHACLGTGFGVRDP